MELNTLNLEKIINNHIRPKVNVDGGDVKFEGFENNTLTIGAYANCAICPRTSDGALKWWIEKELLKQFDEQITVIIKKNIPYYHS